MKLNVKAIVGIAAAVVSAAAVVLAFLFSYWWFLMFFIPVFSMPLLRGEGVLGKSDDHRRLNHYRSSHLAFYVTLMLVVTIMIGRGIVRGEEVDPAIVLIAVFAVLMKEGGNLILNRPQHQAGILIGCIVGAGWLLYAMFAHGISLQALLEIAVGLAILGATGIALVRPWIGGGLLAVEACLSVFYLLYITEFTAGVFLGFATSLPLLAAALFVWASAWTDVKKEG
jgi:hypothetical protein